MNGGKFHENSFPPKQEFFSLELEPCGQMYRMVPDSIGEDYANYVSIVESYSQFDKTVLSERKSKTMLDAFAMAELADLYDESFIEENMKS